MFSELKNDVANFNKRVKIDNKAADEIEPDVKFISNSDAIPLESENNHSTLIIERGDCILENSGAIRKRIEKDLRLRYIIFAMGDYLPKTMNYTEAHIKIEDNVISLVPIEKKKESGFDE